MLRGWICPNEGRKVGLRHFIYECPDPPFPPVWAAMILETLEQDRAHKGTALTPTTLLTCPRQVVIDRFIDYHALPHGFDKRQQGTEWHKVMSAAAVRLGMSRAELVLDNVQFPGIERPMQMRPDELSPDLLLLMDYKFTNQGSLSFVVRDPVAKMDDCVQASFYAEGVRQNHQTDLREAQVWYMAPLSGRERKRLGADWIRRPVRLLTPQEVLAHKPYDGEYTVEDNAKQLCQAFGRIEGGEKPEAVAASLPLVGQTMMRDRRTGDPLKCWEYCDCNHVCAALGAGQQVLSPHHRGLQSCYARMLD